MGAPARRQDVLRAATPDRPPVKDRPDRLELAGGGAAEEAPPPPPAPRGPVALVRGGLGAAWSCRRILVLILAANLLLAGLVLFPLLDPLDSSLGRNPEVQAAGGVFEAGWWFDFKGLQPGLMSRTVSMIGLAGALTVLLGAFFAGGLLEALKHGRRHPVSFEPMPDPAYGAEVPRWRAAAPGPASIRVFLAESARHFPRFLVLLLLSLPLYALVQLVFNDLAGKGAGWILRHLEDERLALLVGFAKSGLFVGAFHGVTVVFEYARAAEVLRPGTPLLPALALPFRILARRPLALLGVEVLAVLIQAALLAAFLPLDRVLGWSTAVAGTAGFAATQAFIFLRLLIRAGAQAAQLRLAGERLRAEG